EFVIRVSAGIRAGATAGTGSSTVIAEKSVTAPTIQVAAHLTVGFIGAATASSVPVNTAMSRANGVFDVSIVNAPGVLTRLRVARTPGATATMTVQRNATMETTCRLMAVMNAWPGFVATGW